MSETKTVCFIADTRMMRDHESVFGLTNAIDSLVRHPSFDRLTIKAKMRALRLVLANLQEESETQHA